MKSVKWQSILKNTGEFFSGAFDMDGKSTAFLKKEALDEMDNFMLLCYSDLLGIPLPLSYYTIELLPYLADDLEGWERRIMDRKSILVERWSTYDWCC